MKSTLNKLLSELLDSSEILINEAFGSKIKRIILEMTDSTLLMSGDESEIVYSIVDTFGDFSEIEKNRKRIQREKEENKGDMDGK